MATKKKGEKKKVVKKAIAAKKKVVAKKVIAKKKVAKKNPSAKKKKPATKAPKAQPSALKMPLAQLLETWVRLLQKRPDLTFSRELTIGRESHPGTAALPGDAQEFAKFASRFEFSYRIKDAEGGGMLYLSVEGMKEDAYLVLDGEEVSDDDMSMLEFDSEGTGLAAWYVQRAGKPPLIVWDLETMERFASLTEYLTEGAKRAFSYAPCWQSRKEESPLAKSSPSAKTPPAKLEAMLVAQGATEAEAKGLVDWLGADARLLIHAAPAAAKEKKPAAAPKLDETLLTWRLSEMPAELKVGVPASLEAHLFYAGRGDNPLTTLLADKLPEPAVEGVEAGLEHSRLVQTLLAESTDAHVAVKAHGSFVHGFHGAPAAEVEAWLRANGGTLVAARPFLDKVLMVRVENANDGEELVRTAYGWQVRPKAPKLYAFDWNDSMNQEAFELKGEAGTVMLDPSKCVAGQVNVVKLG